MASYRGHLMLSTPLGAVYGSLYLLQSQFDWGPPLVAGGLTALGGLLPDLDSDSGKPIRELFGVMAAIVATFIYHPLVRHGIPLEQAFVLMGVAYLVIRFGVSDVFRRGTVHRGMFHSIPAMFIAGLIIYLGYPSSDASMRLYLAGGVMVGFLSHLILDEFYSIDFNGFRLKVNKFSGSAFKFTSPSWPATLTAYAIMIGLGYCAWSGETQWNHWLDRVPHPSWRSAGHASQTPREENHPEPIKSLPSTGPTGIHATWQPKVDFRPNPAQPGASIAGLTGRVSLVNKENVAVSGDGRLRVELFDDSTRNPVLCEKWEIDAEILSRLLTQDSLGWNYAFFLPWKDYRPEITRIRLRCHYQPKEGPPLDSETPVTLASVRTLSMPARPEREPDFSRPTP